MLRIRGVVLEVAYLGRWGIDCQPLTDKEVDNLKTLLEMLDENNEHDRIMKAEILRELGQFETAMEMLNVIFNEELTQAVAQIKELSEKGEYVVREFVYK